MQKVSKKRSLLKYLIGFEYADKSVLSKQAYLLLVGSLNGAWNNI